MNATIDQKSADVGAVTAISRATTLFNGTMCYVNYLQMIMQARKYMEENNDENVAEKPCEGDDQILIYQNV